MRKRNGFSLIEMLMVFTVIGLIASIVVLQARTFRERAMTTAMKSDLRNFAISQESYYYDHDVYTPDTTALLARGYQMSEGTAIEVNEATVAGWAATAEHGSTPRRCYLYIPGASPVGIATEPGVVSCG